MILLGLDVAYSLLARSYHRVVIRAVVIRAVVIIRVVIIVAIIKVHELADENRRTMDFYGKTVGFPIVAHTATGAGSASMY